MNTALLIAELRRDEGVVRHAYQDSLGLWTIGVGRLIDARKGGGLSDDEIDYLLQNDIARVEVELDVAIGWWRSLDEVRQRVILNMAFNLGVPGLLNFQNTLAAVKARQWDRAAVGMLASRWAGQVHERANRLAHMMRTGETA
jgi:lysozyme